MKSKIKYLVMDVDGTLTDGKIYMGSHGEMCKAFNIKDGCGIHDLLIPKGIRPVIITGRKSMIVENRCRELGITDIYQNVTNKVEKLSELIDAEGNDYASVAYIGDDINDLECMLIVKEHDGVVGCPSDAADPILGVSDFVSKKQGGSGAVREFIEWLIEMGHTS